MLLKMKICRALCMIFFFAFVGCGPKSCGGLDDIPAEEQLRNYIDLAVNITRPEQREELEALTTGEFRDNLSSLTVDAFKATYLDRRFEFDEFEVSAKTEIEPKKEVEVEYRVKFRSWLSGEDKARAPTQEVKSVATLKYTQGQWAIASIRPVDTEYNWDVGLPLDGVSTRGIQMDDMADETAADEASPMDPANETTADGAIPVEPVAEEELQQE